MGLSQGWPWISHSRLHTPTSAPSLTRHISLQEFCSLSHRVPSAPDSTAGALPESASSVLPVPSELSPLSPLDDASSESLFISEESGVPEESASAIEFPASTTPVGSSGSLMGSLTDSPPQLTRTDALQATGTA